MPDMTKEQKIAQFKKQIKTLMILQVVMPLLMIIMALAIMRSLPDVAPDTKNTMMTLLYVFAVLDFGLIRFVMLPMARKNLAALENGE